MTPFFLNKINAFFSNATNFNIFSSPFAVA